MPSKIILKPRLIVENGSLGATSSSIQTQIKDFDELLMEIEWTGTAPVGAITIEVASLLLDGTNTTWTALDFGSAISIAANSGKHIINFESVPFDLVRVTYTRTSGTGTMNVYISGKTLGGVQ